MVVLDKCSSALSARRASSIRDASEHFPHPPVAPSTPLYIALKAQNSAMSAGAGGPGAVSAAAEGAARQAQKESVDEKKKRSLLAVRVMP